MGTSVAYEYIKSGAGGGKAWKIYLGQDSFYSLMTSLREINMAIKLTPRECCQKSIFQCSRRSSSLRPSSINITVSFKMMSRDPAIEVYLMRVNNYRQAEVAGFWENRSR